MSHGIPVRFSMGFSTGPIKVPSREQLEELRNAAKEISSKLGREHALSYMRLALREWPEIRDHEVSQFQG